MDGSLRFSIYYDQLQSLLVVVVLQAEGLLNHGQKHNLQPFVKLSLMWAGSKRVEVDGCTDEEVILSFLVTKKVTDKEVIKSCLGRYTAICFFLCLITTIVLIG